MSTTEKKQRPATSIVTDEVRFSYLNAFVPKKADENAKAKYGGSLLFPKTNTALKARLDAAIKAAIKEGPTNPKSKWNGKTPPNLKLPIRDGDVERPDDPAYAGMWFFNANSDRQPGIVDANLQKIISATEIYSGCYGRADINFYAFGGKQYGIACGLNNLQKLRDGEAMAGGQSAEFAFGGEDNDDL